LVGAEVLSTGAGHFARRSLEDECLPEASPNGEETVHAEIDMGERTWLKAVHDVVGHYNRFDVFTLDVDRSP
jgi:hypothetical protein